jgi:hypothetical protein
LSYGTWRANSIVTSTVAENASDPAARGRMHGIYHAVILGATDWLSKIVGYVT